MVEVMVENWAEKMAVLMEKTMAVKLVFVWAAV